MRKSKILPHLFSSGLFPWPKSLFTNVLTATTTIVFPLPIWEIHFQNQLTVKVLKFIDCKKREDYVTSLVRLQRHLMASKLLVYLEAFGLNHNTMYLEHFIAITLWSQLEIQLLEGWLLTNQEQRGITRNYHLKQETIFKKINNLSNC